MVPILSLWMPILLAAVLVFVVSSVIHMFLKYHQSDFEKLPSEDDVLAALRPHQIPPGDYFFPYAGSMEAMRSSEYAEKATAGPVGMLTVMPSGLPSMGKGLTLWFGYSVLVGVFAAYIAGRTLGPGAEYLTVFQITGATAFIGYSMALIQSSIWYHKDWAATMKSVFDGFLYALVTAGACGWLWPS